LTGRLKNYKLVLNLPVRQTGLPCRLPAGKAGQTGREMAIEKTHKTKLLRIN